MIYWSSYHHIFVTWPELQPKGDSRLIQGDYRWGDSEVTHIKGPILPVSPPTSWKGRIPEMVSMRYNSSTDLEGARTSGWTREGSVLIQQGGWVGGLPAFNVTAIAEDDCVAYVYKAVGVIVTPPSLKKADLRQWAQSLERPHYYVTAVYLSKIVEYSMVPITTDVEALCEAKIWPDYRFVDDMLYRAANALRYNANNVENVGQVYELIQGIRNPLELLHRVTPKTLKDAWLAYRYSYETTKSDLLEGERFISETLNRTSGTVRLQETYQNTRCNLKFRYWPHENNFLQLAYELIAKLHKLGLQVNAYTAWDAIPFSFVADWFLPIGDYLERLDAIQWFSEFPYEYSALLGVKGTVSIDGLDFRVYERRFVNPSMDLSYFDSDDGTSGKTWGKRTLDLWALRK